jgi:GAF domain-containing protein
MCVSRYQDDRFNRSFDAQTGFRTRSVLCMPIRDYNGEIIGVVQAMNHKGAARKHFNDEDASTLGSFISSAAVAIENNLVLEKTESALNHVLQVYIHATCSHWS